VSFAQISCYSTYTEAFLNFASKNAFSTFIRIFSERLFYFWVG